MGPLGNVADRHQKTISILQPFWLEIDELTQVLPVILIKIQRVQMLLLFLLPTLKGSFTLNGTKP